MIKAQKTLERDVISTPTIFIPLDPSICQEPLEEKHFPTEKLHQVLSENLGCRVVKQSNNKNRNSSATTEQNLANKRYTEPKPLEESLFDLGSNYGPNCKKCKYCEITDKMNYQEKTTCQYDNPLRLCGGAPDEDENDGKPRAPISANHFDKVLAAYQKAIDPRRQMAAIESGAPSYSIKLFDASDDSLDDKQKSTCGRSGCPSGRLSVRFENLFGQSQSENSCGLSGCPYIKAKEDAEREAAEGGKIAEFEALQRSATKIKPGSKCPSSFLPPIPPLKTIHWDCPDPLPDGPCKNPQCPLKPLECRDIPPPKGSCGTVKCPYSLAVTCGDECPLNPPEPIPYSPPPPLPPPCPPPPCSPPPPCYLPPPCPPPPPCYPPPPCPPPPPCYPPPPCTPPPCYSRPPSPQPPCYLPHPCHPPPRPPTPCYLSHPCPPTPPSCRNPKCPFSPPPRPPTCPNPRCPFSPPPCPPKPPLCPNPKCPHSPPSCPPRPSSCPSRKC